MSLKTLLNSILTFLYKATFIVTVWTSALIGIGTFIISAAERFSIEVVVEWIDRYELRPYYEYAFKHRYLLITVCLVSFIFATYAIQRRGRRRLSNAMRCMDEFQREEGKKISKLIRKYGNQGEGVSSQENYKELCGELESFLSSLSSYLHRTLECYTGRHCHISIKTYNNVEKTVTTRIRAPIDIHRKVIDGSNKTYPYKDNLAFSEIIDKADVSFFMSNRLRLRHLFKKYNNANSNWKKLYNATLVVPITRELSPSAISGSEIMGFICVDNKGGRFDDDVSSHLVQSFARICYNVMYEIAVYGDEEDFEAGD